MPASKKDRQSAKERIQRTEAYADKVRQQFASAVNGILALNKRLPELKEGQMYSFDGAGRKMRREVDAILRDLHSATVTTIRSGIQQEWTEANKAVDEILATALGRKALSNPNLAGWFDRGEKAMDAFMRRTQDGFNLSRRIWNTTTQLREEMEVAMTVAIGEGESASQMSRRVRQYLDDPDLMFRRFRYKDEDGNWQRKWKKKVVDADGRYHFVDYDRDDYKVGRGMYKSAYKNAMRVTRTETNIAYRRADHERWQGLDFVLGQRIQVSGSHPKDDICDELAGDYPKDFVFDGWHPQCFCICTPIMADEEEMRREMEAALNGEEYEPGYEPITAYPEGFQEFVRENADNIKEAMNKGTAPYFIANNEDMVDRILQGEDAMSGSGVIPSQTNSAAMQMPQIGSNAPDWSFTQDKRTLPAKERLANIIDNIEHYYGEDYVGRVYRPYIDFARQAIAQGADEKTLTAIIKNTFRGDLSNMSGKMRPNFEAINHLRELKASSASSIPAQWSGRYAELVKEMNAHDFVKYGYKDMYSKIEEAYNISKLAENPTVRRIGFDKISHKTPYNFFTEYVRKYPDWINELPPKEFFDAFDEFVPLVNGTKLAYYEPTYKYVQISLKDKDYALRLATKEARRMIIPHEFGHAYDWQRGLRSSDADIRHVWENWKKEIRKDNGVSLESAIKKELNDFNGVGRIGFDEELGALSDCLQAALGGSRRIRPLGHPGTYFADQSKQIGEFIAHCSENYWAGNDMFRKLQPQLYKEMCDLIRKKWKIK